MHAPRRTIFLGWDRPAMLAACDALLERSSGDTDLSATTLVLPGARAGRLVLGELVRRAEEQGTPLSPPRICTPGGLASALLATEACPAGELTQRLAWATALRSFPARELEPLVPTPPAAEDPRAWAAIASTIQNCVRTLAGEGLRVAAIPTLAEARGSPTPEPDRWHALANITERYLELLASEGLTDPDNERLEALDAPGGPRLVGQLPEDVVLVGITDLPGLTRRVIEHVADRVTALVFAPDTLAHAFDAFGCIRPDAWTAAEIPIPDDRLLFADTPADAAERALESVAQLGGRFAAHEITIGVPDAEVVPQLTRRAARAGVTVRYAGGDSVAKSAPFRLLEAIGDYLADRTPEALCTLIRHPDMERALLRLRREHALPHTTETWLAEIDDYCADHVLGPLDGYLPDDASEGAERLRALRDSLAGLLDGLGPPGAPSPSAGNRPRPIAAWAEPLLHALERLYTGRALRPDVPDHARTLAAAVALRDTLLELGSLRADPDAPWPSVRADAAIRAVLDAAADLPLPEEGDDAAVELLGWLELPFDPAPVAVITGLNEGTLPSATAPDSYLCESLRDALGIASARTRFARDAYLLSAVLASRPHVTLISGRRSASGDPLLPSRLIFACDAQTAVARVRRFTTGAGDAPLTPRPRLASNIRPGDRCRFNPCPRVDHPHPAHIPVTAFKTYLASPYLFFLQHVLRLSECGDPPRELDPLAYGNLLHAVLESFGSSNARDADDPARVREFLFDTLDTRLRHLFGDDPPVAVWLQAAFARSRLEHFAQLQAQRRREGWKIEYAEWRPTDGSVPFAVDGEPMGLRGKIDRIDRHERTGAVAILDYKTGESVSDPDKSHRGRAGWRDLQLPMYRHLAREIGLPDDPALLRLGYIALPRSAEDAGLRLAPWTPGDFDSADAAAADVIRAIRDGTFFSAGPRPPVDGAFAALCGVGTIVAPPVADEPPDGAPADGGSGAGAKWGGDA